MGIRLYYHRLTPRRLLRVLHDYDAFFRLHIETIEAMLPNRVAVFHDDSLYFLYDPVRRRTDWGSLSEAESRPTTDVGKTIGGGHRMHDGFRDRQDFTLWYYTPDDVEAGAEALFRASPDFNEAFDLHWPEEKAAERRSAKERLCGDIDRLRGLFLAAASEGDAMVRYWW